MTDSIEPALSAEAWASIAAGNDLPYGLGSSILDELVMLDGADVPAAVAYLNHRLPDSDPRKITRERVKALRREADWWAADARDAHAAAESRPNHDGLLARATALSDRAATLAALADALASYLPPERP